MEIKPIVIDEFRVTRLFGGTYAMRLRSGPYLYEADCEGTLAGVMAALSGAMKFFGIKYGLITVEKDGLVRNKDQAGEWGLL